MDLYSLLLVLAAVASAFVISVVSMPAIIKIAKLKHLIDAPDGGRKLHENIVPTLGGIGIFSAFIISYSIWGSAGGSEVYPFFIAALFLLFLIGVKDDILVISPAKKFIVQIAAACLLVGGGGVYMADFGGILGIHSVNWVIGGAFSIFLMVAIINSFNLIDGIDGLAGGIGVIVSGIFGIWFWGAEYLSLAILSFTLCGALIGFLTFNMHPAKIFMGDTGSMAVGFILGYLSLEFLTLNPEAAGTAWYIENAEVLAVSILIIPIIDTLRVFTIRVSQGRSPFVADRNHTHHKLIDHGLQHHYASFSLWIANIGVIGIAYRLAWLDANVQLLIVLLIGSMILPAIKGITSLKFSLHYPEKKERKKSRHTAYEVH